MYTKIMEGTTLLLVIAGLGLAVGTLGSFAIGLMTMIGIPALLFVGLSPQVAIATMMAGIFGARLGSLHSYKKAHKIVWRLVWPLAFISLVGALIGARVLLAIDEVLLGKLIGASILLFTPLLVLNAHLGVKTRQTSRTNVRVGLGLYLLLASAAAFFAPGAGVLLLYIYVTFFGLTILEMRGTDIIPGMVLSVTALVVFAVHHVLNIHYALAFGVAMYIGAAFGSQYAIRLGDARLRWIIVGTAMLMAAKLLFT